MRLLLVGLLVAPVLAQEAEMQRLARRLGAEDYAAREAAERRLERLVREGGQAAFDLLETRILPAARGAQDAEIRIRVERLVRRLSATRLLWWAQLEPCPVWGPRIAAQGDVVVRTGESGLDVLDALNGTLLWSRKGAFDRPLGGIHRGVVYASQPPGAVAAYTARTGEARWTHAVADLGGDAGKTHRVHVFAPDGSSRTERRDLAPSRWSDRYMMIRFVPAWGRTIVATLRGYVVALDADGNRLWHTNVSHERWARNSFPRVAPELGLVFSRGSGEGPLVVALRADTGDAAWRVPIEAITGVASGEGRVFVTAEPTVDGRLDGRLHCLDGRTGRRRWTFRPPPGKAGTPASETIRAGAVTVRSGTIRHEGDESCVRGLYVLRGSGIVIAETLAARFGLRAADGGVLWRQARGDARVTSVSRHGLAWGSSPDGEILGFDPRNGRVARRIRLSGLRLPEDAPKLVIERGGLPPREEYGALSMSEFDGDVLYATTASGLTFAVRVPPFRGK